MWQAELLASRWLEMSRLVRLVDRPQQIIKTGDVINRPHPCEVVAQPIQVVLGEQGYRNDWGI